MTDTPNARTPDGVNNQANVGQAGEGGAYPNPHTGKTRTKGFGGGQSGSMNGAKPERDETADESES